MSFKNGVSTALRSCPAAVGFTASLSPVRLGPALWNIGLVVLTITSTQAAVEDDRKLGQNFPFAFAMRGCTQEDAPALEIYLTRASFNGDGTPSLPYLRIEIASPPNETIGPLSLQLIPLRRDPTKPGRIARAELMESGHKSTWLSGTIALDEAPPGSRVSGRYDFTLPAGGTLSQNFTAEYSKRPTFCG